MGVLMQLMALPAACLLFTWARHGRVDAIKSLLRRLVALMAVSHATKAHLAPGTASTATTRERKSVLVPGLPSEARKNSLKVARNARHSAPRKPGIGDPVLRLRRMRSRLVMGGSEF